MPDSLLGIRRFSAWCWSYLLGGHEDWYVCLYAGGVLSFIGLDGWIGIIGKATTGTLSLAVATVLLFYGEYGVILGVFRLVRQTSGFRKPIPTDESLGQTLFTGAILLFVAVAGSLRIARKPAPGLFLRFHEVAFAFFALVFACLGLYSIAVGLGGLLRLAAGRARKDT